LTTEYLNPPTLAPPVHGIYTQIVIGTDLLRYRRTRLTIRQRTAL
jgi:hypothetical protein